MKVKRAQVRGDDFRQRYTTVVADPPWQYGDRINTQNRGAANHYPTMSLMDIVSLSTGGGYLLAGHRVANNAHLYLWTTNAFIVEAHTVMTAWGFTYKTMLTWVKPQIGMGHYFRNNTEHILFGVRGKLPLQVRNQPTAFTAPRLKHSQKPDALFDIVEACSPGPYLELFARRTRPGWTVWGNEVEGV